MKSLLLFEFSADAQPRLKSTTEYRLASGNSVYWGIPGTDRNHHFDNPTPILKKQLQIFSHMTKVNKCS